MDEFFTWLFGISFVLLLPLGLAHCQKDAYIDQSRRLAVNADWEWIGCETAYVIIYPTRVTCLVKDENGKIVDIDNIRSD